MQLCTAKLRTPSPSRKPRTACLISTWQITGASFALRFFILSCFAARSLRTDPWCSLRTRSSTIMVRSVVFAVAQSMRVGTVTSTWQNIHQAVITQNFATFYVMSCNQVFSGFMNLQDATVLNVTVPCTFNIASGAIVGFQSYCNSTCVRLCCFLCVLVWAALLAQLILATGSTVNVTGDLSTVMASNVPGIKISGAGSVLFQPGSSSGAFTDTYSFGCVLISFSALVMCVVFQLEFDQQSANHHIQHGASLQCLNSGSWYLFARVLVCCSFMCSVLILVTVRALS